ncbi:MAG: hypothetical protein KF758_00950 [Anaerolineales bacterium]|nr:hypothetical protein [Anaerolineales bacterium]MBX3035452.1 hypothetical protein [Anaerolineales bacterium]
MKFKSFCLILKKIIVLLILSSVIACGGYGGIAVDAGPLSVTVSVNGRGEIEVDSNVAIPLVGNDYLGVSLIAGYSFVLNEAQNSNYKLYIVWQEADEDVRVHEYDVKQKFEVKFSDKQIVKKIEGTGNGSFVVLVEVSATSAKVNPAQKPTNTPDSSCESATVSKIVLNKKAYVCTKKDRLIIREVPGGSEVLRLYPNEIVYILDGPRCYDFSTWWKIEIPSRTKATVGQTDYDDYFYTDRKITGWAREGGDYLDPYYLCQ